MDREGAYDFGRDGVAGAEPGKSLAARALESEERLQLALEAGRMGTWEWEVATSRVVWSAGLEEIHGLATGSFAGTFEAFQEDIHPEDRERVLRTISGTVERGDDHHIEYRILLPDGSLRWVEGRGRLFRDEAGAPARMIGVCLDVTERKENEQRRALLLDEFSHRIKNIMAIVQSIAGLTLRETPEPEAFKRAFQSRLAALDTAHSLLTRQQWRGACLTDLVAGTLAPFGGGGRQEAIRFQGPPLLVEASAAVTLCLVLHELATNAVKYGALSVPDGRIEISWDGAAGDGVAGEGAGSGAGSGAGPGVELAWIERGGPAVEAPEADGFGTRLFSIAAAQLGGDASVRYESEGVEVRLRFPLSRAERQAPA